MTSESRNRGTGYDEFVADRESQDNQGPSVSVQDAPTDSVTTDSSSSGQGSLQATQHSPDLREWRAHSQSSSGKGSSHSPATLGDVRESGHSTRQSSEESQKSSGQEEASRAGEVDREKQDDPAGQCVEESETGNTSVEPVVTGEKQREEYPFKGSSLLAAALSRSSSHVMTEDKLENPSDSAPLPRQSYSLGSFRPPNTPSAFCPYPSRASTGFQPIRPEFPAPIDPAVLAPLEAPQANVVRRPLQVLPDVLDFQSRLLSRLSLGQGAQDRSMVRPPTPEFMDLGCDLTPEIEGIGSESTISIIGSSSTSSQGMEVIPEPDDLGVGTTPEGGISKPSRKRPHTPPSKQDSK